MCFNTFRWVVEHAAVETSGEMLTLIMLANFRGTDDGVCTPSHETLSKKTKISVTALKIHLAALEKKGLIQIVARFNGPKKQTSNSYLFPLYSPKKEKVDVSQSKSDCTPSPNRTTNQVYYDPGILTTDEISDEIPEYDFEEESSAEKEKIPYAEIVAAYHKHLPALPRKLKLIPSLKNAIKARWREDKRHRSLAFWDRFFEDVGLFPFYAKPDQNNTWKCNLDFLVRATKFNEMIERIEDHYARRN